MASFFGIKTRSPSEVVNAEATKQGFYKFSEDPAKPKEYAYNHFRSQLIWNEQLLESPDGLYTWILKDITGTGANQFIAGRTRTKQETGTLHNNLDYLTGPGVIRAAGELQKIGLDIEFNLQSGTYTKKLMDERKTMGAKRSLRDTLESTIVFLLRSFVIGEGGASDGIRFRSVTFRKADKGAIDPDVELAGIPMINSTRIVTTAENRVTLNTFMNFIPLEDVSMVAAPTNGTRKRPRKGGARRQRHRKTRNRRSH